MAHLSWNEVRDRAIQFARFHAHDRSESAEKQTFWNDFFHVFGLRRASLASFEANVTNIKGNKGAIDLLWKGRLLVEHKSYGEDLALAKTQAFTYIEDLTRANRWDEIPRFVLVSDFANFTLYDLEPDEQRELPLFAGRKVEPHHFTLKEFPRHIRAFAFMLGQTRVRLDPEDPANEKAYKRMCDLHDALKDGGFTGHDLERLLVRILFCLFAEDTAIFAPDAFTQYLRTQTREDGADCGAKLNELFDWLNNPAADGALDDTDPFYGFRYVNGGLFAERLGFPRVNREMRNALLECCDFQWARISPAVFGSLFQGVLDDKARRQQGAHYTSERDIMKVLRSLFLDELNSEWGRVKADRSTRRRASMEGFHQRLRSLQFLDPACGCGNFLVLAYRELRTLELSVASELNVKKHGEELHAQQTFKTEEFSKLIGVNVDQFHGIEYSEWPARIAEVALWLMDHQMNQQAGEVFGRPIDRLPLKAAPHIVTGNALRREWSDVLPPEQCSYVLGNPPFIGSKLLNDEQRADMSSVWSDVKGAGVLDYVTAWYRKAAEYMQNTKIITAFVSTNSISQGEQPGVLWGALYQKWHLKIHFAHRTFVWESEARGKAHVHCVIIGFAAFDTETKFLYDYECDADKATVVPVKNISPYLIEGGDFALPNISKPVCDVPELAIGNKPIDDGNYLFTDEEKNAFIAAEPASRKWFRKWVGSDEFINGWQRWCLWLRDCPPNELRAMPKALERVEAVKAFRLASKSAPTRKLASSPLRFHVENFPTGTYLVIPKVSSERRPYIPIGFQSPATLCSDLVFILDDATLFHFGVLSSNIHMAWMRQVAGRLESRYRYSTGLVYNNFPWPNPTPDQRARVETAAQAVLNAREPHLAPRGMSTLADLYDPLTMPSTLAKAHADLDRAVEKCYRSEPFRTDRERVEHLFRLYEQVKAPLLPPPPRMRGRVQPSGGQSSTTPRRSRSSLGLSDQQMTDLE